MAKLFSHKKWGDVIIRIYKDGKRKIIPKPS